MKYTVVTSDSEDFTFQSEDTSVVINVDRDAIYWFTFEEFREFRKAVGFVWQEIEQAEED